MPTARLHPDSTIASPNTARTGGTTIHGVLSDASDATYVRRSAGVISSGMLDVTLGTATIAAGERIVSVVPGLRYKLASTNGKLMLIGLGQVIRAGTYAKWKPQHTFGKATAALDAIKHASAGAWLAPDGAEWTQADVDALMLSAYDQHLATDANRAYLYELYADVFSLKPATVDVTGPASPVTDTSFPTIGVDVSGVVELFQTNAPGIGPWLTGGDVQIRVFTDAVYGASGFDPATAAAVWETTVRYDNAVYGDGTTPGTVSVTAVPDVPLPSGDTYRVYARASRDVPGGSKFWGAWDYQQFVLSLVPVQISNLLGAPNLNPPYVLNRTGAGEVDVTLGIFGVGHTDAVAYLERLNGAFSVDLLGVTTLEDGAFWEPVVHGAAPITSAFTYLVEQRTGATAVSLPSYPSSTVQSVTLAAGSVVAGVLLKTYAAGGPVNVNTQLKDAAGTNLLSMGYVVCPAVAGENFNLNPMPYHIPAAGTYKLSVGYSGGPVSVYKSTANPYAGGNLDGVSADDLYFALIAPIPDLRMTDPTPVRGASTKYRVRVETTYSGVRVSTEWYETATIASAGTLSGWDFYHSPVDTVVAGGISRTFTSLTDVQVLTEPAEARLETVGTFLPHGRTRPVIVGGDMTGWDGTYIVRCMGAAEIADFEAMLAVQAPVFVDSGFGERKWIRVLDRGRVRRGTPGAPVMTYTLRYVEVAGTV